MIAYFPELYPDELVYSCLARYYEHSGYLAYIFCAEDIFVNKRVRPEIEFINELKEDVVEQLCKDMSIGQLILEHTMFPYYARFLPFERRNEAFQSLCNIAGDYHNQLAIPKQKNGEQRKLRYCPRCVKDDRSVYGETYWHREHQMYGVNYCPKHGCRLIESSVLISGKASPHLTSAEYEIRENGHILSYGNEVEKQLAKYVGAVFQEDINMENQIVVGDFLHSRLYGTEYVSVRGEQRKIKAFTNDFMAFYIDLSQKGLTEMWQIQKVFNGYRFNLFEVCQIAMFLNIPVSELCDMELPDRKQEQIFDDKVKELHSQGIGFNRIAKQLGVSSKTIRDIAHKKDERKRKSQKMKQTCGVSGMNWEQKDKDTLPLVQNAIKQIQGNGEERPHKVTEFAVCRILGLPDKGLQHLPECKKEVLRNKETWEQYWSREIIWAVHKLQREEKVLNWKQIRVLTNMRKENLIASLSYMEQREPEIADRIKALL